MIISNPTECHIFMWIFIGGGEAWGSKSFIFLAFLTESARCARMYSFSLARVVKFLHFASMPLSPSRPLYIYMLIDIYVLDFLRAKKKMQAALAFQNLPGFNDMRWHDAQPPKSAIGNGYTDADIALAQRRHTSFSQEILPPGDLTTSDKIHWLNLAKCNSHSQLRFQTPGFFLKRHYDLNVNE